MATIQSIFFDLDGTLVDTERTAVRVMSHWLQTWKVTVSPTLAQEVTGRTWSSALDLLYSRYEFPLPQDEAMRTVLRSYQEALETKLETIAGAAEAVRSLSKRFELGLVSGSFRRQILWALGQLGVTDHFKIILGAEDYPKSKPAPDGYLKALKTLGRKAENVVVFEDSTPGIQAARTAGTWVIAVTAANHYSQNIQLAHHQVVDLTPVNPQWISEISKAFSS